MPGTDNGGEHTNVADACVGKQGFVQRRAKWTSRAAKPQVGYQEQNCHKTKVGEEEEICIWSSRLGLNKMEETNACQLCLCSLPTELEPQLLFSGVAGNSDVCQLCLVFVTCSMAWKAPWQLVPGKDADVSNLRGFVAMCYVLPPRKDREEVPE